MHFFIPKFVFIFSILTPDKKSCDAMRCGVTVEIERLLYDAVPIDVAASIDRAARKRSKVSLRSGRIHTSGLQELAQSLRISVSLMPMQYRLELRTATRRVGLHIT